MLITPFSRMFEKTKRRKDFEALDKTAFFLWKMYTVFSKFAPPIGRTVTLGYFAADAASLFVMATHFGSVITERIRPESRRSLLPIDGVTP